LTEGLWQALEEIEEAGTRKGHKHMTQFCSLLSIVFMMSFVIVFDKVHHKGCNARFCLNNLLASNEVDQIRQILAACQDC